MKTSEFNLLEIINSSLRQELIKKYLKPNTQFFPEVYYLFFLWH